MTQAIWQYFLSINGAWHCVFMGLTAFVETLFPPFPGDVLYIALSGLGTAGGISVFMLWLPGFLGCMASTLVLYSMGKSPKLEKLESLIIKASGKNGFERSKRLLEKHGVWLLVFSRFVPGIRSLLVIAAASTDMKKRSVLASAGLSVILWYGLMVFAGTVLGAGIDRASEFMSELTGILVVAVLAVLTAGVAVFLFRLKRCGE